MKPTPGASSLLEASLLLGRYARAQTLGRLLAFVVSSAGPAAAENDPAPNPASAAAKDEASRLHLEGERARASGDWGAACPFYRASLQLDPSAPTQVRVAQCFEREGKLASALRSHRVALGLAERLDEPRRRAAEAYIPGYIATLERRVPKLSLRRHALASLATVWVDDLAWEGSDAPDGLLFDPGRHQMTVTAPGFVSHRCVFELVEGDRVAVQIEPSELPSSSATDVSVSDCERTSAGALRILLAAAAAPNPWTQGASSAPKVLAGNARSDGLGVSAENMHEVMDHHLDTPICHSWGMPLTAGGLAGLGVAGYFGIRTLMLVSDADCDDNDVCSEAGGGDMAHARAHQTAGFVALGVGAAMLGAGVALLLTKPEPQSMAHHTETGIRRVELHVSTDRALVVGAW